MFSHLRRRGFIESRYQGNRLEITITKQGRKIAQKHRINELTIPRPKKWDEKWRIVAFDIPTDSNFARNLFRQKLQEFGFYSLQKSVWAYPFPCKKEIGLLREFLGANKTQIRYIEATSIENDAVLRKVFRL